MKIQEHYNAYLNVASGSKGLYMIFALFEGRGHQKAHIGFAQHQFEHRVVLENSCSARGGLGSYSYL